MEEQQKTRNENINRFMKSYSVFIDSSLRNIFDTDSRPKEKDSSSKINMDFMKHTFKSFSDCLNIYKECEKDLTGINTFIFIREAILGLYNMIENSDGFTVLPYSQQVLGAVNHKFDGMTSLYKTMLDTKLDGSVVEKSKLKFDSLQQKSDKLIKIDERLDKYFINFCQGYATEFANIIKDTTDPEKVKSSMKQLVDKYLKDLHLMFPKRVEYLRSILIVNGYYLVLTSIRNANIANSIKAAKEAEEAKKTEESNNLE